MRSLSRVGLLGLGMLSATAPYTGNTTSREPEPEPQPETRQQRRYRERQERKNQTIRLTEKPHDRA